jgi:hypothetical protein
MDLVARRVRSSHVDQPADGARLYRGEIDKIC